MMLRLAMPFDFDALSNRRRNHPSWRLMAADNAPLILSFLDRVFREENVRQIDEDEMVMRLEDYLFSLRDGREEDSFPRSAADYLDEWSAPGKEWLRKFYPDGSDIPHFDLTPATERVLQWIDGLFSHQFIGTESRLNTCFDLLRQIVQGVEKDKDVRIGELEEQKKAIDRQISRIASGDVPVMDERQIRERFLQFRRTARELLGDFRAVDNHFRALDREIREDIATWEGEKGELLEEFFHGHDAIEHSDEGRSFQAFWDFIMAPDAQEELSAQLDRIYQLEELGDLRDDQRLKRIHFDWMEAGGQTQGTVRRLSRQLRRYLDDRAFWENRRIIEILDSIEKKAVGMRDESPGGTWMSVDESKVRVALPMEQSLYTPSDTVELVSRIEVEDQETVDTDKLFDLVAVDRERLQRNIDRALEQSEQVTLAVLLESYPLEQGLTEVLTYLLMAEESPTATVDDSTRETVQWSDPVGTHRRARLARIIFSRRSSHGSE
ncbi:MAG: DUF3375 domain-containing protein [Sphaerochaetaceae bacterium]|nr:DUF3375 domain-containing protein [Sphaerochaetaceae bacterium]